MPTLACVQPVTIFPAERAGSEVSPRRGSLVSAVVDGKVIAMPVSDLSDAILMERTRLGDREAFEEIVARYRQPVMNLARRTVRDMTEAEDLAQNVFVQVYKAADRYRPTAKFSTWLFTIARNLCLNEIRRRVRHPAESMDAKMESDDGNHARQFEDRKILGPDSETERTELYGKVDEAIRDLPESQRTALLIFREGDQSYEEIAAVMNLSVSAVKSLIFRGRDALKKRLKPYLKTGEWSVVRANGTEG